MERGYGRAQQQASPDIPHGWGIPFRAPWDPHKLAQGSGVTDSATDTSAMTGTAGTAGPRQVRRWDKAFDQMQRPGQGNGQLGGQQEAMRGYAGPVVYPQYAASSMETSTADAQQMSPSTARVGPSYAERPLPSPYVQSSGYHRSNHHSVTTPQSVTYSPPYRGPQSPEQLAHHTPSHPPPHSLNHAAPSAAANTAGNHVSSSTAANGSARGGSHGRDSVAASAHGSAGAHGGGVVATRGSGSSGNNNRSSRNSSSGSGERRNSSSRNSGGAPITTTAAAGGRGGGRLGGATIAAPSAIAAAAHSAQVGVGERQVIVREGGAGAEPAVGGGGGRGSRGGVLSSRLASMGQWFVRSRQNSAGQQGGSSGQTFERVYDGNSGPSSVRAVSPSSGYSDGGGEEEEGGSVGTGGHLSELYRIQWWPRRVSVKLRQPLMTKYSVSASVEVTRREVEFDDDEYDYTRYAESQQARPALSLWGYDLTQPQFKVVFKPRSQQRQWKMVLEPQRGDIRFLTRKIPLFGLLSFQIGVGHDFRNGTTGWKWKLTSAMQGASASDVNYKHTLPMFPGFDLRVGLNAEYCLPDLQGAVGTGEPTLGLNVGRLYAGVERLEAIFTGLN